MALKTFFLLMSTVKADKLDLRKADGIAKTKKSASLTM
jgi:hypothetical protein